jgi:hypothetical protein
LSCAAVAFSEPYVPLVGLNTVPALYAARLEHFVGVVT